SQGGRHRGACEAARSRRQARGALRLLGGSAGAVAADRARRAVRRGDLLGGVRVDETGAGDLPAHGARARRGTGRVLLRRRRRERRARRRPSRRDDPGALPAGRRILAVAGGTGVGGSTGPIDGGGARAVLITTMNDIPGYTVEEVYGEVFGLTVRSRNLGSQM